MSCASFMLKKGVKLCWLDDREFLGPDGSAIDMTRFKEAFLKQFYLNVAQLKKQQEFTHLIQGGCSIENYA